MAKIWPVYEGREPTIGGPWAELPLAEAVSISELQPDHFESELEKTPRFGNVDRDGRLWGYKHIVVEIQPQEARKTTWKAGYYKSPVAPGEMFRRLIQRALVSALGSDNVVRATWEPGTDPQNRDVLKITVIVTPDAPRKLAGKSLFDARIRLQEQLSQLKESRIPMIEYTTEKELAEDAGSKS